MQSHRKADILQNVGLNHTLDLRLMEPLPFLSFFPTVVLQSELEESVNFVARNSSHENQPILAGPPKITEPLAPRESYDPRDPIDLSTFGSTKMVPLGDIALARSGDKGGNVNIGIFVHSDEEWKWLRSFLTIWRFQELMREDWKDWFFIERVEFANIKAVHFVVYGLLGRGVSGSARLDSLGKGFGEFIRARHVPVPEIFL
jgi:hypothetical protein